MPRHWLWFWVLDCLIVRIFTSQPQRRLTSHGSRCQKWNTTTFVGFDLVCSNVALDLLDVKGASTKAASNLMPGNIRSRVEWVQGNFLKPLPFADGEFDYIHVSGIARGVPEDRVSYAHGVHCIPHHFTVGRPTCGDIAGPCIQRLYRNDRGGRYISYITERTRAFRHASEQHLNL